MHFIIPSTVFIELNFTVAFLLLRKTWNDRFVGKVRGWGILRNGGGAGGGGGIPVMGDDFETGGGWYTFTNYVFPTDQTADQTYNRG